MVLRDHDLTKDWDGCFMQTPKYWRRNKDCMVERLPNEARSKPPPRELIAQNSYEFVALTRNGKENI